MNVLDVIGAVAHQRVDVVLGVAIGDVVLTPNAFALLSDQKGLNFSESMRTNSTGLAGATALANLTHLRHIFFVPTLYISKRSLSLVFNVIPVIIVIVLLKILGIALTPCCTSSQMASVARFIGNEALRYVAILTWHPGKEPLEAASLGQPA